VNTWQTPDASVDCVIFNRSLHHINDLPQTMVAVKRLVKPGGRIICQDYAYDRFDEQTACWLYQMQRLLFPKRFIEKVSETAGQNGRKSYHLSAVLNRYPVPGASTSKDIPGEEEHDFLYNSAPGDQEASTRNGMKCEARAL